jgi:hypothetical protein
MCNPDHYSSCLCSYFRVIAAACRKISNRQIVFPGPELLVEVQRKLVVAQLNLVILDYIHFPPYTGELSKTEQG